MRFVRVPIALAVGHILGQNVSRGERRLLKKGVRVGQGELARLLDAGVEQVFVAQLDAFDVQEDAAAQRIAEALTRAAGLKCRARPGGRVTLVAAEEGLWQFQEPSLYSLNSLPGVALATLKNHTPVVEGQTVATLKIVPFALPERVVVQAVQLALAPVAQVQPWRGSLVHLLVTGREGREDRLLPTFRRAIEQRFEKWGKPALSVRFVPLSDDAEGVLTEALSLSLKQGANVVLLAGETATMDDSDVGPLAISALGGTITVVGAPVFPGNLLLLGDCQGCTIVGMPGCMRSPEANVVDLILPRILAGQQLSARDVAKLGAGGLLSRAGSGTIEGAEA